MDFCILVVFLGVLGVLRFFVMNPNYMADMFMGEKTILEGEFTIVNKNKDVINGKTFTLESDTKKRYVVQVSDTIYQSYFVNDKIKAAFASYEKTNICDELEIRSTFEKEIVRKED